MFTTPPINHLQNLKRNLPGFGLQTQVLELLASATSALAGGMDYEKSVGLIADLLVKDFATWCTIDLVNDDGTVDRVAASHRNSDMLDLVKTMQTRYPASPTATRGVYRAIQTRQSILIPTFPESDWARRADDSYHLKLILELGSNSYMVVPLVARNRAVGAIMLLSKDRTFDEDDLKSAEQFANWIAIIVDNLSMLRKMNSTLLTLESTQRQLDQASKMAALGVISAGIAHEINNPLAIIRLSSEKVRSFIKDSGAEAGEYLNKMQNGIDRIVQIIQGINHFSRAHGHKHSPVNFNEVVTASAAFVEDRISLNQIHISLELCDQEVVVNGTKSRLEQVFINLLTNAIDAIVSSKKNDGKVSIKISKTTDHAIVEVADNGVGLNSETLARVFDPFFSTKGSAGMGLGLSISLGIIQDHSGKINVESKVGCGSRVQVSIPLQKC